MCLGHECVCVLGMRVYVFWICGCMCFGEEGSDVDI